MIHLPHVIDVGIIAGLLGVIGLLGRTVWRVTRFLDHLAAMLEVWEGAPERPGVVSRLDEIERKVDDVHYNVKPNHGGSAYDAQTRLTKEILTILKENDNA